jgi:hypothetical protein
LASSGAGLSAGTESSAEVLQCLLEADLGRIELAHRCREAVFGEIVRIDLTRSGDQLHGPHRRLVMAVGEHVDVGVGDALAVKLAGRFS